jgi:hypothetical protein
LTVSTLPDRSETLFGSLAGKSDVPPTLITATTMCASAGISAAPQLRTKYLGWPVEDKKFLEPPPKISGCADRYDPRGGADD